MKKGKKAGGAPAHVQLFSTMMILLLAFFIVLTSLIDAENDTGFQNNIGDIQNAFGIRGGIGMLAHHFTCGPLKGVRGKGKANKDDTVGLETRYIRGSGGTGTNETETETGTPTYLQVVVPHAFEPGSDRVPPLMAEYLDVAGTVLAVYPAYHCTLRQVTRESGNWQTDTNLAHRRAANVRRYLHMSCALPLTRVSIVGYADWSVLPDPMPEGGSDRGQTLVFELWKPDGKQADQATQD